MGGVARNVAEAAHRNLEHSGAGSAVLVAPLGEDHFGVFAREQFKTLRLRYECPLSSHPTPACNMILNDKGALIHGVADMEAISSLRPHDVCGLWLNVFHL